MSARTAESAQVEVSAAEPVSPAPIGDLSGIPNHHGTAHDAASMQDCKKIDVLLAAVGAYGSDHQTALGNAATKACQSDQPPCQDCKLWEYAAIAKAAGLTTVTPTSEEAK